MRINQNFDNGLPISEAPLPPYGFMHKDHFDGIDMEAPPLAWTIPPAAKSTDRRVEWAIWRQSVIEEIADVLWPIFDLETHSWMGRSTAQMRSLTEADLDLLAHINGLAEPPLSRVPRHKLRGWDCPENLTIFNTEDGRPEPAKRFGEEYNLYDRSSVIKEVLPAMRLLFSQGNRRKVGSASLQFKLRFQRPRPYQASLVLGRKAHVHLTAIRGDTPSMQSGHCLQGLLSVGNIMERFLADSAPLGADNWEALQQWSVDIGDRRVMAGVHYPSDNIASWILAMRLADRVFTDPQVKQKLWNAIEGQSFIYEQIKVSPASKGVYKEALALLLEAKA